MKYMCSSKPGGRPACRDQHQCCVSSKSSACTCLLLALCLRDQSQSKQREDKKTITFSCSFTRMNVIISMRSHQNFVPLNVITTVIIIIIAIINIINIIIIIIIISNWR